MSRRGLSLVELLATITIVGILAVLTVNAVQSARETARRASCLHALRQIGIALQNYQALHSTFPPAWTVSATPNDRGRMLIRHGYSIQARILDHLEQSPLYHAINFTLPSDDGLALWQNHTVMLTKIELFLCPSDHITPVPGYARNNLRFTAGLFACYSTPTHPVNAFALFPVGSAITPAQITDGLSHTLAASERLQGDWDPSTFRRSGDIPFHPELPDQGYISIDEVVSACRSVSGTAQIIESRGGESWFLSGLHFTQYNACTPPNDPLACILQGNRVEPRDRAMLTGCFPATSAHPGGVNTLRIDGSARFISDSIDIAVWRALNTRSAGEIVNASNITP